MACSRLTLASIISDFQNVKTPRDLNEKAFVLAVTEYARMTDFNSPVHPIKPWKELGDPDHLLVRSGFGIVGKLYHKIQREISRGAGKEDDDEINPEDSVSAVAAASSTATDKIVYNQKENAAKQFKKWLVGEPGDRPKKDESAQAKAKREKKVENAYQVRGPYRRLLCGLFVKLHDLKCNNNEIRKSRKENLPEIFIRYYDELRNDRTECSKRWSKPLVLDDIHNFPNARTEDDPSGFLDMAEDFGDEIEDIESTRDNVPVQKLTLPDTGRISYAISFEEKIEECSNSIQSLQEEKTKLECRVTQIDELMCDKKKKLEFLRIERMKVCQNERLVEITRQLFPDLDTFPDDVKKYLQAVGVLKTFCASQEMDVITWLKHTFQDDIYVDNIIGAMSEIFEEKNEDVKDDEDEYLEVVELPDGGDLNEMDGVEQELHDKDDTDNENDDGDLDLSRYGSNSNGCDDPVSAKMRDLGIFANLPNVDTDEAPPSSIPPVAMEVEVSSSFEPSVSQTPAKDNHTHTHSAAEGSLEKTTSKGRFHGASNNVAKEKIGELGMPPSKDRKADKETGAGGSAKKSKNRARGANTLPLEGDASTMNEQVGAASGQSRILVDQPDIDEAVVKHKKHNSTHGHSAAEGKPKGTRSRRRADEATQNAAKAKKIGLGEAKQKLVEGAEPVKPKRPVVKATKQKDANVEENAKSSKRKQNDENGHDPKKKKDASAGKESHHVSNADGYEKNPTENNAGNAGDPIPTSNQIVSQATLDRAADSLSHISDM